MCGNNCQGAIDSGGNCPEAHFPSRNILDGSCSVVNCPENNCPRCELPRRLIIWGEIVRRGLLSCHPFYVILTFSFVVRIEAGDCILLLNNFLFKLLKTSYIKDSEAVARSCSVRKSVPKNFAKKRFWYRCFPVNFAKFLRTPFLAEHLRWLLLMIQ